MKKVYVSGNGVDNISIIDVDIVDVDSTRSVKVKLVKFKKLI